MAGGISGLATTATSLRLIKPISASMWSKALAGALASAVRSGSNAAALAKRSRYLFLTGARHPGGIVRPDEPCGRRAHRGAVQHIRDTGLRGLGIPRGRG